MGLFHLESGGHNASCQDCEPVKYSLILKKKTPKTPKSIFKNERRNSWRIRPWRVNSSYSLDGKKEFRFPRILSSTFYSKYLSLANMFRCRHFDELEIIQTEEVDYPRWRGLHNTCLRACHLFTECRVTNPKWNDWSAVSGSKESPIHQPPTPLPLLPPSCQTVWLHRNRALCHKKITFGCDIDGLSKNRMR